MQDPAPYVPKIGVGLYAPAFDAAEMREATNPVIHDATNVRRQTSKIVKLTHEMTLNSLWRREPSCRFAKLICKTVPEMKRAK